jgi:hypothetical protein
MPGQRQSIDDLFKSEAASPDAPVVIPHRSASPAPSAVAKAEPSLRHGPHTAGVTEFQTPKWQRLERKELRLRADQLDELAKLRRALNRRRGGEGERITENTLIRVAVDLLLKQADALQGSTEDELRNSVTS